MLSQLQQFYDQFNKQKNNIKANFTKFNFPKATFSLCTEYLCAYYPPYITVFKLNFPCKAFYSATGSLLSGEIKSICNCTWKIASREGSINSTHKHISLSLKLTYPYNCLSY